MLKEEQILRNNRQKSKEELGKGEEGEEEGEGEEMDKRKRNK